MEAEVEILPVRTPASCCYIVRSRGCVLVDTPIAQGWRRLERALRELPAGPSEVKLIVLTHGHADHVGCSDRARALTGATVTMHRLDAVAPGTPRVPPGTSTWGRIMRAAMHALPGSPTPPVVDVTIDDEGLRLTDYGVPGRLLHTPGHTAGSVSLLLDTGQAFVGDLAMNGWPMRSGPGMPTFAEDTEAIRSSWRRLLALGARTIYPGHGPCFPATALTP